jgi:hypothetical protein
MFPFPTPLLMVGQSAAGGSGPSSKWRINILTTRALSNQGAAEIEMRATVGGADQCSGGSALASATVGGPGNEPDKAFDNNSTTFWNSGSTTLPAWIEYDFPANVDVRQLGYLSSGLSATPTSLNVQYYDIATSSWVTYWSEDTFEVSTSAPQFLFSKPDPAIAGSSRWRVKTKSTQGGSSNVGVCNLELRATSGGPDLTVPASATGGNPIGDGTNKENAFDDNSTTIWSAAHPTVASPKSIGYRFPTQQVITEIAWNINGMSTNGAPTSFDVEYLDTTTGLWTVAWSVASTGTWTTGETKVFTKP